MEPLSETEIETSLAELAPGWRREGEKLVCDLELENFAAVIALVNRIADAAESADHHPDLLIHGYRNLRVELSTHSAGGLRTRDFSLAAAIDAL
ncbi:MAG TPA: 4a-hydroxytetrahydrobiopterin dehydratase [Solirubrobacteraceae bacterium]|jgi:4a-hydroxytetrahydrobiopterin dehydratase|nr:4a-hydroxytetrahydrobiopterin dehydratase [Solirubrobacteraceae bacterium]